jgi:hypothetical protein
MKAIAAFLARVTVLGWLTPLMLMLMLISSLLLLVMLPAPNVLVSASLESESVDVRVLSASEMMLSLPRAVVDDGAPACRSEVAVRVEPGGRFAFSMQAGRPLHIATYGPTQWTSGDGASGSAPNGLYLEIAPEGECAFTGALRLPAVGELSVGMIASGSSSGDEFLPLTDGELTVYGRAVNPPPLVKWIFFFLPLEPEKLYLANTFPVPPGSQVEGGEARFWGFLEADIGGTGGLHVEASTNARELNLMAPAPRASGDAVSARATALEADRVSMTLGAQLAGDPNLHLIFWAIAGLFAGVGFVASLVDLVKKRTDNAEMSDKVGKPIRLTNATGADLPKPAESQPRSAEAGVTIDQEPGVKA